MSFCRLNNIHSLGSRPLNWTCIPREKNYNGISSRASGGRRSTTGRERYQRSRPERDSEGDGSGIDPLWDSNVESVRRKNKNRSDGRESSSQSASTPDWLTPKKEWTFNNAQENRKGEKKAKAEEELPWWKPKFDYDDGETEDEEEFGDTKSFLQGQVYTSLRWGIPLSLLVLPWLLGNPLVVLLGLAALPAVQRAVSPSVSELWNSFLDVAGSPSQKRRREAEAYDFSSDEGEDAYSSWGGERDNGQPYRYKKPASYGTSPAEPFPYSDVDSNINRPVLRQGSQQAGQEAGRTWKLTNVGGCLFIGRGDHQARMEKQERGEAFVCSFTAFASPAYLPCALVLQTWIFVGTKTKADDLVEVEDAIASKNDAANEESPTEKEA